MSQKFGTSPPLIGTTTDWQYPSSPRAQTPPIPVQVKYSFPKHKIKILLLENIHPTASSYFKQEGFSVEEIPHALNEEELIEKISGSNGIHLLGIRSKTRVTKKVLENVTKGRLLAIGCFCIGTDQVDLVSAEKYGIVVYNAPFSNTRSVAELVLSEIIALSRKLSDVSMGLHQGFWRKSYKDCKEVRGKVLGIVGYGHIGSQLSVLCEAMGMKVIYYDIVPKLHIGNSNACNTLEGLLKMADYVSLHVPKSHLTRSMIGKRQLAMMKKGAILINASRGTVVDIEALANAIKEGHLGGAAIDVYPVEPAFNGPGFQSPLQGLPNVILTPHIGGSTQEAQMNIGKEVATAMVKYVNVGSTFGSVNFPNVDLPQSKGCHRILNIHKNVPGVLRDVNNIFAECDTNVATQVLGTTNQIGYLVVDVDKETSLDTKAAISRLETSIKTRILY